MDNFGEKGKLPPVPQKGTDRGAPAMKEDPRTVDMMRQIASQEGERGGDNEQQSAQMLMQGAKIMMQAAQLNPQIAPIVQRAMMVIKDGIEGITGGAGSGPPPIPKTPKPAKKSKKEVGGEMGEEEEFM